MSSRGWPRPGQRGANGGERKPLDSCCSPTALSWSCSKIPLLHVVAGAAAFPFFVVLKRIQLCAAEEIGWSTTARDIERIHLLGCANTIQLQIGCFGHEAEFCAPNGPGLMRDDVDPRPRVSRSPRLDEPRQNRAVVPIADTVEKLSLDRVAALR